MASYIKKTKEEKNMPGIIVFSIFVIILMIIFAGIYCRLVVLRNHCLNAWIQVEAELNKRADLVPHLVETVKRFDAQENKVFEQAVKAKTALIYAKTVPEAIKAQYDLTTAFESLFALNEKYPQLKTDKQSILLQDQFRSFDIKIEQTRDIYRNEVLSYNEMVLMFPANIIAGIFNFEEIKHFNVPITEGQKEAIRKYTEKTKQFKDTNLK